MATQTKSEAIEYQLEVATHHHAASHNHEQGEHDKAEPHAASVKAHGEQALESDLPPSTSGPDGFDLQSRSGAGVRLIHEHSGWWS